jgi:hypothetical protein|nr:MAG TPA_asm: hypothetical protein [Bacteriophage sp.]
MATYLDNAGVTQILTKIKSLLAKKAEVTAIPTNVSQLTNDRSYQTPDDVTATISTRLGALDFNSADVGVSLDEGAYFISSLTQEDGLVKAKKASFTTQYTANLEASQAQGDVVSKQQVQQAISNAVGKITSFEYKIVDSLPVVANGQKGVIYLVAHRGGTTQNIYDEYIFLPAEGSTAARYEKIGTTDIDLTPYAKKTEIPVAVSDLANDLGFITDDESKTLVTNVINGLDYTDTAETGKYVSSVSQENGKIKVTRASLPAVGTADSPISNTTIESIFTQVFG